MFFWNIRSTSINLFSKKFYCLKSLFTLFKHFLKAFPLSFGKIMKDIVCHVFRLSTFGSIDSKLQSSEIFTAHSSNNWRDSVMTPHYQEKYWALPLYLILTFPNLCSKSSWTTINLASSLGGNFLKKAETAWPDKFIYVLERQINEWGSDFIWYAL